MDAAHRATDKILEETEKEITAVYQSAYKDVKNAAAETLNKMNFAKNMTPEQRLYEAQKYNRLKTLEDQITDVLNNANAEAVKIINNRMVNVYSTNYGEIQKLFPEGTVFPILGRNAVKSVLSGQITPFKHLALESLLSNDEIRRTLTRNFLSGIMQGESIPDLSKRIQDVANVSLNNSIRIARTETTRVENSARQDIADQGAALGFKMKKKWISTSDSRTRPEHTHANGQVVDYDKPFTVGGEKMMYPGAEGASAGNVINCRCTMTTFTVLKEGE